MSAYHSFEREDEPLGCVGLLVLLVFGSIALALLPIMELFQGRKRRKR